MIRVNISMVFNHCKNLLEETYRSESLFNITALLARLAQTITKNNKNKIRWLLFPREKITVILLASLQYVVPLSLIAPSWGTSPYSWLKVPLFQAGGIIRFSGTRISNWLFIQEIKCNGATLSLWKGFQARSQSLLLWKFNTSPPPLHHIVKNVPFTSGSRLKPTCLKFL